MNNVLILSAGRRVELVQAFQQEIRNLLPGSIVIAADMSPGLSAACQVADHAIAVPRIDSGHYVDYVLEQSIRHHISLVVPTIDTELLLLAQERERFASMGVSLVVSDMELVTACRDKRKTKTLFESLGIDTPAIYPRDRIEFPCFVKPYDGSSSIGAAVIRDRSMLSNQMWHDNKLIFMELLDRSWTEYTVDVYFDRHGILKCLVPRQRIETRGGEVSKGVTRRNHLYDYLLTKLTCLTGARGCITMQIFADLSNEHFSAIELNPRFGGGYPLSYSAGANFPGWLLREYILNEQIPSFDLWKKGSVDVAL